MNLSRFARRLWPIWAGAVLGLLAGVVAGVMTPATYAASTTLFLGSPVSTDSSGAYSGDLFSQQRAVTYTQLFASNDLAAKVIDDLSLELTPAQLISKVTAIQVPKTVLLEVSVADGSAQEAADIANAYATNFTEYVARLETPVGQQGPSSVVTVIQEADVPESPSSTSGLVLAVGGLLAGAFAGALLLWLLDRVNRSVRTSGEAAEAADTGLLAAIPADPARRQEVLQLPSNSAYAEGLRHVRTGILHSVTGAPAKTIAFVGPKSGLATTATACNLAVLLAELGREVVVVDADLRSPRVPGYLGVTAHQGLTTLFAGGAVPADVMTSASGVDILLGGPPAESPSLVLSSDSLTAVFDELAETHDSILVDTPGLVTFTDAALVARACDGVVIVAEQGKTNRDELAQTASALRNIGANVLGVVVTECR